jgi:hypothetical protein
MENDAEIFPAHYTWKVAHKGFKMASMMNKLAMVKFFLKNKINFFAKNQCEVQVRTILICTLCLIKYGKYNYRNDRRDSNPRPPSSRLSSSTSCSSLASPTFGQNLKISPKVVPPKKSPKIVRRDSRFDDLATIAVPKRS